MKKILSFLVFLMIVSLGWGQTNFTATYTFGADGNVQSFAYNGTVYDGFTMNNIEKIGVTTSSSNGNFRATQWPTGATSGSDVFTGTVDLDKYIGFTITAADNYKFTVNSITFGIGRSGAGTRQSQWRGSHDNYAAIINNYTSLNVGLTNESGVLTNPDLNSSWTGNELAVGTDYEDITGTVGFRYYLFNSESTAGTAGLQGPITISGSFISLSGYSPPSITNISRQYTVPTAAQTCDVQCDITGGTAPYTALIKYSVNSIPQVDIAMSNTGGDTYSGTIPAQSNGARVEYYIEVTDSEADATETSSTYGLFWGVSPISNAAGNIKALDANYNLLYDDYYCTVTGVASVDSGIFSSSNLEIYMQDAFGGINLYKGGAGATSITEGNSYTVTGQLDFYNGKTEIIPDNPATEVVDNGFVGLISPNVKTIAELLLAPEDYENTLVGIMHMSKDSGTWAANQNLTFSDGTGTLTFRLDGDTNLDENPEPVWPRDVVGIFTQYDNSSPYDEGYQIMPRSIDDIKADGFLPVSLSSFTVEFVNNHPLLHWTTQSETDNLGWNIYRSLDQNGFSENNFIQNNSDMIPGMGISTQPTDYSFVDEYPVIEGLTYWYWLESVSTTNEMEQHGPVSLAIPIQGGTPHVSLETALDPNYPNPFNPSTTISFNIEDGETGTLTIYNLKGQTVYTQKYEAGSHKMEWNADGLSSGVYFYRLTSPSKNITRKMVMMK